VKDKKSLHNNTPSNAIVNAVSNVFVLRIKIDNEGRLKTNSTKNAMISLFQLSTSSSVAIF
jgi:hypothetical protein